MASDQRSRDKIIVYGDNDEPFGVCEVPDAVVILAVQPYVPNMTTVGAGRWKHHQGMEGIRRAKAAGGQD
jgi:hypothetical protein